MTAGRTIAVPPPITTTASSRVLYVGTQADEICMHLADSIGDIDLTYNTAINDVFATLRERAFDVIVLDLRSRNPAIQLALPIICSIPRLPRVVVICQPADLSSFLRLRGVWRVLTEPLKGEQLQRAVAAQQPTRRKSNSASQARPEQAAKADAQEQEPARANAQAARKPEDKQRRGPIDAIFGIGMSIVSMLYKRTAFVLLAALFSAFAFYGVLIAFFLLSNSWAAPMTLTKGHELVEKAEAELNQLKVSFNLTKQRLAENKLEHDIAAQTLQKAKTLTAYFLDTTDKQIRNVKVRERTLAREIKSQKELVEAFGGQIEGGEFNRNLKRLYDKRLIDRTTYQSGLLGLLEAKQRMQALTGQLAEAQDEYDKIDVTLSMLESLKARLMGNDNGSPISATTPDMMQLATQSLEARASVEASTSAIAIATDKLAVLERSKDVLELQIAKLESAPLARAMRERLNVLYVPYDNEHNFTEGRKLVSCALTILWCSDVGRVGQRFPGESTSVHPFFGKPIRGFFVEIHLTDQTAAQQEIIHANRAPLFF
jgi:hypothetical protein